MTTFTYFAYGSNMLLERLQARCPSAEFVGIASAANYTLAFGKLSTDGSAKANFKKRNDGEPELFGALFEIALHERETLCRVEAGYDRDDAFEVRLMTSGKTKNVSVYAAFINENTNAVAPYDWYHQLLISGAMRIMLPREYIEHIDSFQRVEDPESARVGRVEALRVLEKARL